MYQPRHLVSNSDWIDGDGIKIYTLSVTDSPVEKERFLPRLAEVKTGLNLHWPSTAAFVIFHRGASLDYLVLAWWGNDNELFTSVSVNTEAGWIEDPTRYSFCLYDMDVFWRERTIYIETIDCTNPSLIAYRQRR